MCGQELEFRLKFLLKGIYPKAAARSMSATIEFVPQKRLFVLRCDTPEGRCLGVLARDDWFLKSLVLPSDLHFLDIFQEDAKVLIKKVSSRVVA